MMGCGSDKQNHVSPRPLKRALGLRTRDSGLSNRFYGCVTPSFNRQ